MTSKLLACGITVILDWIILCGGAVLCPGGFLAAPLGTPHWRLVAAPPPMMTTKNVRCPLGGAVTLIERHCLN